MKCRLPFAFSYERFENTPVCIISRFRPILNFPIFCKNGASVELLNIVTVFENSLPKGSFMFFWWNKKKIRIFWTAWRRILDSYRQRLLNMNRSHRFCFPPFFFSFISRTLLVHNWFVFAMCLVGNRIQVCFEFYCSARFLSLRETPAHYSFITKQNNKNNNKNTHALYW